MHTTAKNRNPNLWRYLLKEKAAIKLVAFPGHFLHWLGVDPVEFEQRSSDVDLACCSHVTPNFELPAKPTEDELKRLLFANSSLLDDDLPTPSDLSDAALYATCVQSDLLPCEWDQATKELYCRWNEMLELRCEKTVRQFEQQRPSLALILQGFEPQNAMTRSAALRLGIPILAVENTARRDRFVWDEVSGLTSRNSAHSFYWRHKNRFPQHVIREYCQRMIQNTKCLKSIEHQSGDAAISAAKPFKSSKPYVLFLGQVYTDSSQVFGLRQWLSPIEVLQSLVDWCQANEFDLVVQLHPKESQGVNPVDGRAYQQLTYRKIINNPQLASSLKNIGAVIGSNNHLDTYSLMDGAAAAVTVNSQSGLEAAIRGLPVVVCGDASFGGLDFTFDASRGEYFSTAMRLAVESGTLAEALPSAIERTEMAQEFAYVFYEHYCRPKTIDGLLSLVQEKLS